MTLSKQLSKPLSKPLSKHFLSDNNRGYILEHSTSLKHRMVMKSVFSATFF